MLDKGQRLNYAAVTDAPIKSNEEGSAGFTEQMARENYAAAMDAQTTYAQNGRVRKRHGAKVKLRMQ